MRRTRVLTLLLVAVVSFSMTACTQKQNDDEVHTTSVGHEIETSFVNLTPEQVDKQSALVIYGEETKRDSITYDIETNKLNAGLPFNIITFKVLKVIRGDYVDDEIKFYNVATKSVPENYGKSIIYLADYQALDQDDIRNLSTSYVPVLPTAFLQEKDGKWIMRYDWKDYLESRHVLSSTSTQSASINAHGTEDYEIVTQNDLVSLLTNVK